MHRPLRFFAFFAAPRKNPGRRVRNEAAKKAKKFCELRGDFGFEASCPLLKGVEI
jgi:hypothetical protein